MSLCLFSLFIVYNTVGDPNLLVNMFRFKIIRYDSLSTSVRVLDEGLNDLTRGWFGSVWAVGLGNKTSSRNYFPKDKKIFLRRRDMMDPTVPKIILENLVGTAL